MFIDVYGFVSVSGGHKQFCIVGGKEAADSIFTGKLLRFGKFEKALAWSNVGDWLQVTLFVTSMGTFKIAFTNTNFNTFYPKDFAMTEQYYVSVLSVAAQVPQSVATLAESLGSQLLVKTIWFTVAETGKPYIVPTPFNLESASKKVDAIVATNALAAVIDERGDVVYMPNVTAPAVAKPAVKPAKTKPVAPKAPVISGDYFYFEQDANLVLSTVASQFKKGFTGAANILVAGDSGTGKTTIAKRFAEKMGWGCHRLNCALITEASDIAGQRGIKNNETTWEWSAVGKAIAGGNCVIILDELNRAYPNALNALFGLLDDSRRTWFNDVELVVGPNVVFFATINEGAEYTGTFQADAALLNRFQYVFRMGNIPEKERQNVLASNFPTLSDSVVKSIVAVGNTLTLRIEAIHCPIRSLKAVAAAVASGMSHREAWEFTFVNALHDSYKREVIDLLNSSLGVYNPDNTNVELLF